MLAMTCRCVVLNGIEIQATLLNPDMCNPYFRINRTDWNVQVPSYTRNSYMYMHNPDFA